MTLKSAIKKAITDHSKKYIAKRVWGIKEQETASGDITIWIEVSVKRKKSKP